MKWDWKAFWRGFREGYLTGAIGLAVFLMAVGVREVVRWIV